MVTLNHPVQGDTKWYSMVDQNWTTLESGVKCILTWGGYANRNPGYPVPWGVAIIAGWMQLTDNEAYSRILLPFGGTIKNLYVALNGSDGTTHLKSTVLKNGSATTLIADLNGVATGNDSAHSASIAAGDQLSIKCELLAGTAPNCILSLELDPS